MKPRKDIYLVGYAQAGNVVYGKRHLRLNGLICEPGEDFAHPLTLYQAKAGVKKLRFKGAKIFKLVEVNP
jgi:hypothetical protein